MVGTWLRIPPPLPLLVIRKLFVYNPSSTFTPGFCFLRIFYLPFSFSSSFNFFFSFFILFGSPFLFLSCSCLKLTFLISHLLLFIHPKICFSHPFLHVQIRCFSETSKMKGSESLVIIGATFTPLSIF
uniref:Uncharacterized protein n=1 Tax=Cacopsylla melanoneura TaxID=428564 RepID=A0A8D9EFV8_9HEMI